MGGGGGGGMDIFWNHTFYARFINAFLNRLDSKNKMFLVHFLDNFKSTIIIDLIISSLVMVIIVPGNMIHLKMFYSSWVGWGWWIG